jgi:hypothetical protein
VNELICDGDEETVRNILDDSALDVILAYISSPLYMFGIRFKIQRSNGSISEMTDIKPLLRFGGNCSLESKSKLRSVNAT